MVFTFDAAAAMPPPSAPSRRNRSLSGARFAGLALALLASAGCASASGHASPARWPASAAPPVAPATAAAASAPTPPVPSPAAAVTPASLFGSGTTAERRAALESALSTLDAAPTGEPADDGSRWGSQATPGAWVAVPVSTRVAATTSVSVRPGPKYWGVATYYGADFQGQPMAAGPLFDMRDPTVTASNSWPLGTRLRITRIPGGPWDSLLTPAERDAFFHRSIVVTVMDRGAFTHALDLSMGAFAELGNPAEGVIHVLIEPVDGVPPVKGLRGAPAGPDLGG
ncbi:MAG TPA: septal ring lytic transglycosylase RlpA family protein [Dehalococcoidia bacterium]|nr:septal ring lytic transglycosylase RlpA family protein [Dehalococcoidia bacterium]